MLVERRPREGSYMARVLDGIEQGLNIDQMAIMGMSRQQMVDARSHLVKYKYIEPFGNANRPISEEFKLRMSKSRGGVMIRCLGLFRRDASIRDIVMITGLGREQVHNAVYNAVRSQLIPHRTKEQERRDRSVGHKKSEFNEDQKFGIVFARRLIKKGLVHHNLKFWDGLFLLFRSKGKKLPEDLWDRLHLEVFLKASVDSIKGDDEGMRVYRSLGESLDRAWFIEHLSEEKRVIALEVSLARRHLNERSG